MLPDWMTHPSSGGRGTHCIFLLLSHKLILAARISLPLLFSFFPSFLSSGNASPSSTSRLHATNGKREIHDLRLRDDDYDTTKDKRFSRHFHSPAPGRERKMSNTQLIQKDGGLKRASSFTLLGFVLGPEGCLSVGSRGCLQSLVVSSPSLARLSMTSLFHQEHFFLFA